RVRRLRPAGDPVLEALLVDHDRGGLGLRVVVPDRLDEAAIARRALVGDDHAPDRILLAPHAGEADSYGHRGREGSGRSGLCPLRTDAFIVRRPTAAAMASSRAPPAS